MPYQWEKQLSDRSEALGMARFLFGVKSRSKTGDLQFHRDLFLDVQGEADYRRQRKTKAGGRFSQTTELFEIVLKYRGNTAANFLAGGRLTA